MRFALLVLAIGLSTVGLAQEAAPAVDRSGEPALKRLLESMAALGPTTMDVYVSSRNSEAEPFFSAVDFELCTDGKGRFRLTTSSMWGDGARFVSDGKTLMKDALDLSVGATLWTVGASVFDASDELAPKGDFGFVALYLIQGPGALERIAPKECPVRWVEAPEPHLVLEKSPWGKLSIYVSEEKGRWRASRIEYDNWAAKERVHELYPEWVDPPQPGTLDVQRIVYRRAKFDRNTFRAEPAAGLAVDDRRKKDAKPPQGR